MKMESEIIVDKDLLDALCNNLTEAKEKVRNITFRRPNLSSRSEALCRFYEIIDVAESIREKWTELLELDISHLAEAGSSMKESDEQSSRNFGA